MNYIELVSSIKTRPKFFLREKDIYELDTFLRGVSYANFGKEESIDLFRLFKDEWVPSKFKNYKSDWVEAISESEDCTDPFEYFFVIWEEFANSLQ